MKEFMPLLDTARIALIRAEKLSRRRAMGRKKQHRAVYVKQSRAYQSLVR